MWRGDYRCPTVGIRQNPDARLTSLVRRLQEFPSNPPAVSGAVITAMPPKRWHAVGVMDQLRQSEESRPGTGRAAEPTCTLAEGLSTSTAALPRTSRNNGRDSVAARVTSRIGIPRI